MPRSWLETDVLVICEGNTFEGARGNLEEVMWPKNKPGAPVGDRPPKEH